MPVYNASAHVGSAIASVLDQDFDSLELVVVNDGSTDSSGDIAQSFADPRVRLISQSNQGECAARNAALEVARGDYVGFLDADDTFLPEAVGRLVSYLDNHPDYGVVYSDGWFVDERGETLLSFKAHRPREPEGNLLEPIAVGESVIVSICCTMLRRQLITKHAIQFDPSLRIGGDWEFWIRMARVARFGYLDSPTCRYLVHGSNVTIATGLAERRRNLAIIRRRVMEATWFEELALDARIRIARNLLIGVQSVDVAGQRSTMELSGFGRLPARARADLLRWVALDHVKAGGDLAFAEMCLDQALLIDGSMKTRVLLTLLRASPRLTRTSCRAWHQLVDRGGRRSQHAGRSVAQAPSSLRPNSTVASQNQ